MAQDQSVEAKRRKLEIEQREQNDAMDYDTLLAEIADAEAGSDSDELVHLCLTRLRCVCTGFPR